MELTREYILSQITNADGKLIPQRCLSNYLKNHGWYDFIIGYYTDNTTDSIREILYRNRNAAISNQANDPFVKCPNCGAPLKFVRITDLTDRRDTSKPYFVECTVHAACDKCGYDSRKV